MTLVLKWSGRYEFRVEASVGKIADSIQQSQLGVPSMPVSWGNSLSFDLEIAEA